MFHFSYEPENQSKCSSETATTPGSPEPPGRSHGWGQLQPAATDAAAATADGEGEAATEAARTASAGISSPEPVTNPGAGWWDSKSSIFSWDVSGIENNDDQ